MLHVKSLSVLIILLLLFLTPETSYSQDQEYFYFPLEEGNFWIYRDYQYPTCLGSLGYGCRFERLEVVESISTPVRKCSIFDRESYELIYPSNGMQTRNYRISQFQLCQEENRLYWFTEETAIDANFPDKDMIADFSRDESQPWIIEYSDDDPSAYYPYVMRRLTHKSTSKPSEYWFESYIAKDSVDVNGIFGYEFVYNPPGKLRDGTGFYKFSSDPNIGILIGSWLNGVFFGDTTFVYPTSIHVPDESPSDFQLSSFPNPFNPTTTITFDLPKVAQTTLKVFDLQGRTVSTLLDEVRSSGSHSINFDASHLSSGIYLLELHSDGVRTVSKITLMK